MKNTTQWAGIAALFLLLACAGTLARQNTMLPALQATWQQLRPAVEREMAVAPHAATQAASVAADAALAAGDAVAIHSVDWLLIESALEADVVRTLADGRLGPLGAESRRALISEFRASRALYARSQP